MRRTLPGVNYHLAGAVRKVAALYAQVPEPHRPDVTGKSWIDLEAEVDAACASGDRERALQAIEDWREHAEGVLSAALLRAPIGGPGR